MTSTHSERHHGDAETPIGAFNDDQQEAVNKGTRRTGETGKKTSDAAQGPSDDVEISRERPGTAKAITKAWPFAAGSQGDNKPLPAKPVQRAGWNARQFRI